MLTPIYILAFLMVGASLVIFANFTNPHLSKNWFRLFLLFAITALLLCIYVWVAYFPEENLLANLEKIFPRWLLITGFVMLVLAGILIGFQYLVLPFLAYLKKRRRSAGR